MAPLLALAIRARSRRWHHHRWRQLVGVVAAIAAAGRCASILGPGGPLPRARCECLAVSRRRNVPFSSRGEGFEKLTQPEHVLRRPDMYIGPLAKRSQRMWVPDKKGERLEERELTISPGFVQLYNEILVNALDRQFQCGNMSLVHIDVDPDVGEISVLNDGGAIPVEIHKQGGVHIPTSVFGEFMSGDNFDDSKIRFTGGRNGIGAKAANVFSTFFEVEVIDPEGGKRFQQTWEQNMMLRSEPNITALVGDWPDWGSVRVRYRPDLPRFGMTRIDKDAMSYLRARALDAAACTGPQIAVHFNGEPVRVGSFESYVDMALGVPNEVQRIADVSGRFRAEVAVAFSGAGGFAALGFVNGLRCSAGTHVDQVSEQLASQIAALASATHRDTVVSAVAVKRFLRIVVKVLVDNPDFDSQVKSRLTTTVSKLGFDLAIPPEFVRRAADLGILDAAVAASQDEGRRQTRRSLAGKNGIMPGKLEDALLVGAGKGDCTLIVTEGDSAKAFAVAGIGATEGRDRHGIFPLRGKLLNVRGASDKQLRKNQVVKDLIQIIGLELDRSYDSDKAIASLRYQRVLILSDQDLDGHHIAGLVINFIHANWPSLLRTRPEFLCRFATPLVKVFDQKKKQVPTQVFFTQSEFLAWQHEQPGNWKERSKVKYYKGLGTSSRKEAVSYFQDMASHTLDLVYDGGNSDASVELAFEPEQVERRKGWMREYNKSVELDYSAGRATIQEFFDQQFIHFSIYDCVRSIPLLLDGLKPSQRKVLHVARRLRGEMKVLQFAGLVSKETNYHHGEASLVSTIVHLAQAFVGTNNINLLQPNGQFGSRLSGRSEHASARYIYTALSPVAHYIFRKEDDAILPRQLEDGEEVEPRFLLPVIPTVLVNGFKGIGTGWASEGQSYHPVELADAIACLIRGEEMAPIKPWYNSFVGDIKPGGGGAFSLGNWRVFSSEGEGGDLDTVEITELPVGVWTHDFLEHVKKTAEKRKITIAHSVCHDHDDQRVHLLVHFVGNDLVKLARSEDPERVKRFLGTLFRLKKRLGMNMWLFHDAPGSSGEARLRYFSSAEDVLRSFYEARLPYYARRREHLLRQLKHKAAVRRNQLRFIRLRLDGALRLDKSQADVEQALESSGLERLGPEGHVEPEAGERDAKKTSRRDRPSFDYLLRMSFASETAEKTKVLAQEVASLEAQLEELSSRSEADLWLQDLQEFREAYGKYLKERAESTETPEVSHDLAAEGVMPPVPRVVALERQRRRRGLGSADAEVVTSTELAEKTRSELNAMCSERSLATTGKKQDLCDRLLACYSLDFTVKEWKKLPASELRVHLRSRGLAEVGTKDEMIGRLDVSPRPHVGFCRSTQEIKEDLQRLGLTKSGTVNDLNKRLLISRSLEVKKGNTPSDQELRDFLWARNLSLDGSRQEQLERLLRAPPPEIELNAFKAELKAELRRHGAPTEGTKAMLEERVKALRLGQLESTLSGMPAKQLIAMCKSLLLARGGNKQDIIDRLLVAKSVGLTEDDWACMPVKVLKQHLRARGLPITGGRKAELISRLMSAEPQLDLKGTSAELRSEVRRHGLPCERMTREELMEKLREVRSATNREEHRAKQHRPTAAKAVAPPARMPGNVRWVDYIGMARKELNITGFQGIGGETKLGQELLAKAMTLYAAQKDGTASER